MRFLKRVIARFQAYTVIVEFWSDSVVIHNARSFKDALEWAACYPNDCVVNINRVWTGKRVAMVGQR